MFTNTINKITVQGNVTINWSWKDVAIIDSLGDVAFNLYFSNDMYALSKKLMEVVFKSKTIVVRVEGVFSSCVENEADYDGYRQDLRYELEVLVEKIWILDSADGEFVELMA